MNDYNFQKLEQRVDELVALCTYLKEQNELIKRDQEQLEKKYVDLAKKNEEAQKRVELTVERLKNLKL